MSERSKQMTATAALLAGTVALSIALPLSASAQSDKAEPNLHTWFGGMLSKILISVPQKNRVSDQFIQIAEMPSEDGNAVPLVAELGLDQVSQSDVLIEGRPTGSGIEGNILGDPTRGPDFRPIYRAIEAGDFDRADDIIQRYRIRYPGFVLPDDMAAALNSARVNSEIGAAIEAGEVDALLALVTKYPAAFECPNPSYLWRVGDFVTGTDKRAAMLPLYRNVVEQCDDVKDRFFAIERSLSEFGTAEAALLLEIEKQRPAIETEADRIADLSRRIAERKFAEAYSAGRIRMANSIAMELGQPGPALQIGYKALAAGDTATAKRWFSRAADWGGGVDARAASLEVALQRGETDEAARLLKTIPVADPRFAEFRSRVEGNRFDKALAIGDLLAAGNAASAKKDAEQATLLGWRYQEQGLNVEALEWFERAIAWDGTSDAYIGATTVSLAQGDVGKSRLYLQQIREQSPRTQLLAARLDLLMAQEMIEGGDIDAGLELIDQVRIVAKNQNDTELLAQIDSQVVMTRLAEAQLAYNNGDYEVAKSRADSIVEEHWQGDQDIHNAAMLTAAWSRYQLNEYRAAASRFEQLLGTELEHTASEGLARSLAADDEYEELAAIADQQAGEVESKLRSIGRDQALARNHVQTAAMVAGKGLEADGLNGIGNPWVQVGVAARYSDGEPGQDRFVSAAPTIAVGVPIGRHRVAGIMRASLIDTDTPQPGDLVGTPTPVGAMGRFDPTDDLYAIEPTLSWTYEGKVQPFAQIGTTPLTGEVDPLPVGEIGAIYHGEGGWRASASLAASSRRDSLLSLAGIDDPTTGQAYGRVIEAGPRIQAVVPVGGDWTVSGEALASTFIGENIVDNDRLGIGAGIAYDLQPSGFEYFAVGPSYRYETYSENEFFFTLGHGGYFSPQEFHRLALDMNFQTNEYKHFLIRGTASVGYEMFEEDAAAVLPGTPGFGTFAASDNKGIAVSGLVEGAYLISPRWQLIGFAGGATASDYAEYVAGLSLRYTFGDRDGLVIRDLFPAKLGFSQR